MGKDFSSCISAKIATFSVNTLPSVGFFFSHLAVKFIFFLFLYSVLRIEPRISLTYSTTLNFLLEFSRVWE